MAQKHNPSLYHAMRHLRKGSLQKALGVPENETIPDDKLEQATHSDNPTIVHMANFAKTLKGFHKK